MKQTFTIGPSTCRTNVPALRAWNRHPLQNAGRRAHQVRSRISHPVRRRSSEAKAFVTSISFMASSSRRAGAVQR
jgi:hypothetical protein